MSIKQRRALVTGGAGGIGSAVAARLAATGASVVIADIDGERLNAVAADLAGTDADVEAVEVDVSDRAAVETMFAAYDGTGGIDILVATAAIVKPAPIIDFDPDDWARVIDINLTGTFHCCQFAARQMVRKGWGRLITISSINGQIANANRGAYSCTKSGVDQLARMFANELGTAGITANVISPAPVDTPMIKAAHGPKDRDGWYAGLPIKRYAMPDEVAAAACFLASDDAAYINGHVLNLDGGYMASGLVG